MFLAVALSVTLVSIFDLPQRALEKSWLVLLALLPLAGTAQFWYTTFYRPSHERPLVNVETGLKSVPAASGTVRIEATVKLANDGATEVLLLDSIYTVTGLDLSPADQVMNGDQLDSALGPGRVASNDRRASYNGLVDAGRLILPGGHLVPGQDLVTSVVFEVKSGLQDKLRFTVSLSALVSSGTNLGDEVTCEDDSPYPTVCHQAEIPIQGWVASTLVEGPVARVVIHNPPDKTPSLKAAFGYLDSGPSGEPIWKPYSSTQDRYPYLNIRGFTTSVEYGLPPLG